MRVTNKTKRRRQCPCYCTPLISPPKIILQILKNDKVVFTKHYKLWNYKLKYLNSTKDKRYKRTSKETMSIALTPSIHVSKGDEISINLKQTSQDNYLMYPTTWRIHAAKENEDGAFINAIWNLKSGISCGLMRPRTKYKLRVKDVTTSYSEMELMKSVIDKNGNKRFVFDGDSDEATITFCCQLLLSEGKN